MLNARLQGSNNGYDQGFNRDWIEPAKISPED